MSKKPNVLIITGYDQNNHNLWKELFDLTLKSKIDYANQHGYDIYITKNFSVDSYGLFTESDIGFLRTVLAFEINNNILHTKKYDYIFWLDADAIITNTSYDITYFIENESSCYFASFDWGSGAKRHNLFNNGNWIIRVGHQSQNLYSVFLHNAKKFPNEQEALNAISHTNEYKNYFCVLEKHKLNSVPNHENLIENRNNQIIDTPWQSGHFLCHFSGLSNEQRLYLIKTYFSEFI